MHCGRNFPRASLKASLRWKNFPPCQSERAPMVEEFPLARVPSIRSMVEEFPPRPNCSLNQFSLVLTGGNGVWSQRDFTHGT